MKFKNYSLYEESWLLSKDKKDQINKIDTVYILYLIKLELKYA